MGGGGRGGGGEGEGRRHSVELCCQKSAVTDCRSFIQHPTRII